MRYKIDGACLKEFGEIGRRFERHPALRVLWRMTSPLLGALCHFGILAAALFCVGLPCYVVAQSAFAPSTKLWVLAAVGLAAGGLACFLGFAFYRRFRTRRVDLDLIALFAGSACAVWYIARTLFWG